MEEMQINRRDEERAKEMTVVKMDLRTMREVLTIYLIVFSTCSLAHLSNHIYKRRKKNPTQTHHTSHLCIVYVENKNDSCMTLAYLSGRY